jgi:hypothetical protein
MSAPFLSTRPDDLDRSPRSDRVEVETAVQMADHHRLRTIEALLVPDDAGDVFLRGDAPGVRLGAGDTATRHNWSPRAACKEVGGESG